MRSASIIASAGLLASASAAPSWGVNRGNWWGWGQNCLSDDAAYTVATHFQTLIAAYTNASATAYLTDDFVDYSSSVNELIDGGCPTGPVDLNGATFTSLSTFEAGQGGQPNITFGILNVWHGCDHVTLRWRSPTPNPGPVPPPPAVEEAVTGVVLLETEFEGWNAPVPYKIKATYSEFNSGAWLYDLGVFTPDCTATKTRRSALPAFFAGR